MIRELQKKITALKQKTDTVILAHSYQREEILSSPAIAAAATTAPPDE